MNRTNGIVTTEKPRRFVDKHMSHAPRGNPPTKKERYGWADIAGEPGQFMWIAKEELAVDPAYQRGKESHITEIAAKWDWQKLACLVVARRAPGVYFIVDGGNRWEASALRSEVTHLPCMVFDADDVKVEAEVFVGINNPESRRSVKPYDRHKAGVVAGRKVPVATKTIIEKHGYKVTPTNGEPYTCAAVARLHMMVQKNERLADRVVGLAAAICGGDPIQNPLLMALFWLAQRDESVFDRHHVSRLVSLGQDAILAETQRVYAILQRGGAKVYGEAVAGLLNKGRRSNKIEVR